MLSQHRYVKREKSLPHTFGIPPPLPESQPPSLEEEEEEEKESSQYRPPLGRLEKKPSANVTSLYSPPQSAVSAEPIGRRKGVEGSQQKSRNPTQSPISGGGSHLSPQNGDKGRAWTPLGLRSRNFSPPSSRDKECEQQPQEPTAHCAQQPSSLPNDPITDGETKGARAVAERRQRDNENVKDPDRGESSSARLSIVRRLGLSKKRSIFTPASGNSDSYSNDKGGEAEERCDPNNNSSNVNDDIHQVVDRASDSGVSLHKQLAEQFGHLLAKGIRSLKSTRSASYELGGISDRDVSEESIGGTLKRRNDSRKQKKLHSILPHHEPSERTNAGDELKGPATGTAVMYNNVQMTIDYVEKEMQFCEETQNNAVLEVDVGRRFLHTTRNRTARQTNYGAYSAAGVNTEYGNPAGYGGGGAGGPSGGSTGGPSENPAGYEGGGGASGPSGGRINGPSENPAGYEKGGAGGGPSGGGIGGPSENPAGYERGSGGGPNGGGIGGGGNGGGGIGGGGGGDVPRGYDTTGSPLQTECPGCCIPGPPGPRGPNGKPGKPGIPGKAGIPGVPGTSPNQTCPMQVQREPPPCRPCPKGPPGIKGWPGFPGDAGPVGPHGNKGKDGDDGEPGEPGPVGLPGFRGTPGAPGDKGETPQGDVKEGPPGDYGPIGPVGTPGVPGLPGRNGLTGNQGERGWPGHPGESGESGYPGPEGPLGQVGPPGEPGTCVCQNVDSVILVGPGSQPRIQEQQPVPYSAAGYSSGSYGGAGGGGSSSSGNAYGKR